MAILADKDSHVPPLLAGGGLLVARESVVGDKKNEIVSERRWKKLCYMT